jgi:hypothetical protein
MCSMLEIGIRAKEDVAEEGVEGVEMGWGEL